MPNRTGKEEEQRRRHRTEIERKTRQPAATPVKIKQKTIHGLCVESSLSVTRSTCKQIAEKNKQTNKHTNKQKQAELAAIAYNTTVDIDDLKPQDNTSTA